MVSLHWSTVGSGEACNRLLGMKTLPCPRCAAPIRLAPSDFAMPRLFIQCVRCSQVCNFPFKARLYSMIALVVVLMVAVPLGKMFGLGQPESALGFLAWLVAIAITYPIAIAAMRSGCERGADHLIRAKWVPKRFRTSSEP